MAHVPCRHPIGRCDVDSQVFATVQAALLDSQDEPEKEVDNALDAVAKFAVIECEMSATRFLEHCEAAYRKQFRT